MEGAGVTTPDATEGESVGSAKIVEGAADTEGTTVPFVTVGDLAGDGVVDEFAKLESGGGVSSRAMG